MAGRTLRVLDPTFYDSFTATTLGANLSTTITVVEHISVVEYREATLLVRLHPGTSLAAQATVTVSVVGDGFTEDDPATSFHTGTLGSVAFAGANSVPAFALVQIKGDGTNVGYFGAMLAVTVTFAQGGTPGNVQPYLSLDLAVKE